MLYKSAKLIVAILFGFGLTALRAQEAIPASGGDISGNGGSVNFTIGQVVYTTNTGISGSVAQGIQQPYEISVITALKESSAITLECSVYPNPTTDYLTLKVANFQVSVMRFQLSEISGKILKTETINGNETTVFMRDFAPATYFLKVIDMVNISTPREIETFKIIKN